MVELHTAINQHGLFNDLRLLLQIEQWPEIPNADEMTEWARSISDVFKQSGLSFVSQHDDFDWQGQYYEQVINLRKIIPTRINCWHDLFNACIWVLFPKTKLVLNQQHMADIARFGLKPRSKRRNAITLLDECGVIIAHQTEQQRDCLRQHGWQQSFVAERDNWFTSIKPFMFGHANYEMGLNPFDGLTGKALFIQVDSAFFSLPVKSQYNVIDDELSHQLKNDNILADNSFLSPMPFLGIPSWYQANETASYYDNLDYFRPKRSQANRP